MSGTWSDGAFGLLKRACVEDGEERAFAPAVAMAATVASSLPVTQAHNCTYYEIRARHTRFAGAVNQGGLG
jgi:hypothetical protein